MNGGAQATDLKKIKEIATPTNPISIAWKDASGFGACDGELGAGASSAATANTDKTNQIEKMTAYFWKAIVSDLFVKATRWLAACYIIMSRYPSHIYRQRYM